MLSNEPALEAPFHLRGYDGRVSVFPGKNRDPALWGFDAPGLPCQPFDLKLAKGYPICEARIEYKGVRISRAGGLDPVDHAS
jgi:hypothetical protein